MSRKPSYEELVWKISELEAQLNRKATETGKDHLKTSDIKHVEDTSNNEEDLAAAKDMLQMVMDNIPQFIFWKNCKLVYLGCNHNFALAAGVGEPESIKGKTDYDLAWKKEEADFFRECDRRVMENDQPEYHIIEPQLQAGGKQAWLDTNKIPLHDPDGNVVGMLGTYEDITERVKTQETLRLYEKIVATTSDLMSILDSDYVYLAVNDAYLKAHAKERDKIVVIRLRNYWAPNFLSNMLNRILNVLLLERWQILTLGSSTPALAKDTCMCAIILTLMRTRGLKMWLSVPVILLLSTSLRLS